MRGSGGGFAVAEVFGEALRCAGGAEDGTGEGAGV